jgi:hypothetical protein
MINSVSLASGQPAFVVIDNAMSPGDMQLSINSCVIYSSTATADPSMAIFYVNPNAAEGPPGSLLDFEIRGTVTDLGSTYYYGAYVAAGNVDHYVIIDNDFSRAGTAPVFDGGLGTNKLVNDNPLRSVVFPLTWPEDMAFKPDGATHPTLYLSGTASQTNGLEIDGADTGGTVSIYPIGSSDSNIPLDVSSHGSGPLNLYSPGGGSTNLGNGGTVTTQGLFAAGANPSRTFGTPVTNGAYRRLVHVSVDLASTATAKAYVGFATTVGGTPITVVDWTGLPAGTVAAQRVDYSFEVDLNVSYTITDDVGAGGTATLVNVVETDC